MDLRTNGVSVPAVLAALALALTGCAATGPAASVKIPAGKVAASAPPAPTRPPLPAAPVRKPAKTTEVLVTEMALSRYKSAGAPITSPEWRDLSKYICKDLAAGGTGLWTPGAAKTLPQQAQLDLSVFNREAAISSDCSGVKVPAPPTGASYTGFKESLVTAVRLDDASREADYGNQIVRYSAEVDGGGSTVMCADGWVSSSGGRQGACSHHGGVP